MTVHFGDCREVMRSMIERGERVQMCVTSLPYFGLRDYGVEGQIGLEDSPAEFLDTMVAVFALVWELLKDDGTVWLNMGDSYHNSSPSPGTQNGLLNNRKLSTSRACRSAGKHQGWKEKDLMGMPWRTAIALQEWGWYLRQDIIWHKPNPMPESVRDRCTKAHEYVFLLSRSPRYYFDQDAIKEQASQDEYAAGFRGGSYTGGETYQNDKGGTRKQRGNVRAGGVPMGWQPGPGGHGSFHKAGRAEQKQYNPEYIPDGRKNKRSVWTIATEAFPGAHFATFPQALIEPCILAGSRPGDTVLDPFFGSGTTGQVCNRLGRKHIGIELNREYEPLQIERTAQQGLEL
ncbi:MAG: site-specific DNA-methyltransferase [Halioglobus sp.]|nr:site-specific DNA-methyltransferase [Halioglobus sp.]